MLNRFFKGLFANKTSNPSKKAPRRSRLGLEALESRWVPAGVVNLALTGGVLTVTGDAADNAITITENATAGSYTVTAQGGTTLTAGAGVTLANATTSNAITTVASIKADMGASTATANTADIIIFAGNAAAGTTLTGTLDVTAGDGINTTFNAAFNVAGRTTITNAGVAGNANDGAITTITGGGTSLGQFVLLDTKDADTTTTITANAVLTSFASINPGDGTNTTTVSAGAVVADWLSHAGGKGNDIVAVTSASVLGTTVNGTPGAVAFTLGAILGTDGAADAFTLTNATIGRGVVQTGTGVSTVNIIDSSLAGFLSINALDFNFATGTPGATSAKALTVNITGNTTITEWVSIVGSSVADAITLNGGPAANDGVIVGNNLNNVAIFTGLGDDTLAIEHATFLTAIVPGNASIGFFIKMGGGADSVSVENAGAPNANANNNTVVQFFGAFNYDGGTEDDKVFLGTDAANRAQFFGTESFDGGAGNDALTETAVDYFGAAPVKTNIP